VDLTATVRKAFKYRLRPTPERERLLDRTLMLCRQVYNAALEQRRTWWGRGQGRGATYYQQKAELPDLKAMFPEYAEVNAQVLQDVVLRVDRAFQAFFRRRAAMAAGEMPGYPRFHGRNRYNSFTYPQYGGGAVVDGGVLSLSKIGRVALRIHRPLAGTPKTVTIRREADGWYATTSCADVIVQPLAPTGQETGIDVGLKVFLVTADGVVVANPRHYREAERHLAKAQRRVSRRKLGSNRRRKGVRLLSKAHQRVRRARRDFHHKIAIALVRRYDTIYHEDLQTVNRIQNHSLAKGINDVGWSGFLTILSFKAACAGRSVIAVPPAYTSQDCSSCGERVPKSLSVRTPTCPSCGLVLDRDENAARNILRLGQSRQALTQPIGAYVA
jgi:putative transposase